MQYPKISIVTPSYNQADYLEVTIQSVLRQDYPDLEYLVVDGGSTDGSVEIIHKYQDRIAWWVSEPDRGQADAINKGFKRATGDIIAWLNSDDIYLPGTLFRAAERMSSNPEAGMVYADALSIDAKGRPFNTLQFPVWGLEDLLRFHIICQPSVFMRRSLLEEVGNLNEDYHYMLDHYLWLKIAARSPILHAAEFWSAARHHSAAKNVEHSSGFSREIMRLLETLKGDPLFSEWISKDLHRVAGGAYRLAARYYLDGNKPVDALKYYWRAFYHWPGYTAKHWHRMVYAVLSLFGGKSLSKMYYRNQTKRKFPEILTDLDLKDWPGLIIQENQV